LNQNKGTKTKQKKKKKAKGAELMMRRGRRVNRPGFYKSHGAISQKMTFFIVAAVKSYVLCTSFLLSSVTTEVHT
jgi:hypothetical protein